MLLRNTQIYKNHTCAHIHMYAHTYTCMHTHPHVQNKVYPLMLHSRIYEKNVYNIFLSDCTNDEWSRMCKNMMHNAYIYMKGPASSSRGNEEWVPNLVRTGFDLMRNVLIKEEHKHKK